MTPPTARPRRSVGVEEELLLFTRSNRPAALGEVLAGDPGTGVEHELKLQQVEIATTPTTELDELAADLAARRRELVDAARDRGVEVAALGTCPVPVVPTPTPDERYERMAERFGKIARDTLICGTHVHVSVDSRAEGVAAIDGVRRWVAALLAISANSPFWAGRDTGYASYRTIAWGRWPSAGPTEVFGSEAAYDHAVDSLVRAGAALDPGMVYFDVRLSVRYPTVEFRIADVGQEVGDDTLLAGLCRALVDTALAEADQGGAAPLPVMDLRAAAWRAARYGLEEDLLDLAEGRLRPAEDLLDVLLDTLGPALGATGDLARVEGHVQRLVGRGTGARLQRSDQARGGLDAVIDAAVERTARATG